MAEQLPNSKLTRSGRDGVGRVFDIRLEPSVRKRPVPKDNLAQLLDTEANLIDRATNP